MQTLMQRAATWLYPPQCVLCGGLTEAEGLLCPLCWRDTPFLAGLTCDLCGARLPGLTEGAAELCDDCISLARPWQRGRAAMAYEGAGRRVVLALKHGDRLDLAPPSARWLMRAGRDVLPSDVLLVPVPIAWQRLLRRRYNQAAELGRALSSLSGLPIAARALLRQRSTPTQDGRDVPARFANVEKAIIPHPVHGDVLKGRTVTLIDDVMTSGATLSGATRACLEAGATRVFVLVLARVEKRP